MLQTKVYFPHETRRWSIDNFQQLMKRCEHILQEHRNQKKDTLAHAFCSDNEEKDNAIKSVDDESFRFEYLDSDKEWITFSDEDEFQEALNCLPRDSVLLIRVTPVRRKCFGGRHPKSFVHPPAKPHYPEFPATNHFAFPLGACMPRVFYPPTGEGEKPKAPIHKLNKAWTDFATKIRRERSPQMRKQQQNNSEPPSPNQVKPQEEQLKDANTEERNNVEDEAEEQPVEPERKEEQKSQPEAEEQEEEPYEYQSQLKMVRDMGFENDALAKHLLSFHRGNLKAVVEAMIKLSNE